jgi:hypothetical protein
MPSRRSGSDLVLFGADDPRPVVNFLCERFGLQAILQAVAEFRPAGEGGEPPARRPYKRRASKKGGGKQGRKSSKKGGGKRGRPARAEAEAEQG